MGEELAGECLAKMEETPGSRRGILTTYLNRARFEERERIAQWLLERSSSRDPDDPSRERGLFMEVLAKSIADETHWAALEAAEDG